MQSNDDIVMSEFKFLINHKWASIKWKIFLSNVVTIWLYTTILFAAIIFFNLSDDRPKYALILAYIVGILTYAFTLCAFLFTRKKLKKNIIEILESEHTSILSSGMCNFFFFSVQILLNIVAFFLLEFDSFGRKLVHVLLILTTSIHLLESF
jgi:hypothetical protein